MKKSILSQQCRKRSYHGRLKMKKIFGINPTLCTCGRNTNTNRDVKQPEICNCSGQKGGRAEGLATNSINILLRFLRFVGSPKTEIKKR